MDSNTPARTATHSHVSSAMPQFIDQNTELDLIDVLTIILRKKFTILAFIIVAALMAWRASWKLRNPCLWER